MPDPSQYTDNIQGAIAAFKSAGSPQESLPDIQHVIQANYDKLNASGYLASGDGQQLGHILRQNWNVNDPTQGGQVKPAAPATASVLPAAAPVPSGIAPAAPVSTPTPAPDPASADPASADPASVPAAMPSTSDQAASAAPSPVAAPDPIGDAFTSSDKATAAY